MKRHIYLPHALLMALTMLSISVFGQSETAPSPQRWAAQINFQQQDLLFDIAVGQLGVIHDVKIRPRVAVDVQRFFNETDRGRGFGSAQIGYFHNLYHDRWLSLQFGIGYELKMGSRFWGSLRMQGGVARVKRADIQYRYEDGVWVETKNEAKANLDVLLSPRLDVGYRIVQGPYPMDIVANTQLTMHVNSRVGAVPYYGLGLGFRIGL